MAKREQFDKEIETSQPPEYRSKVNNKLKFFVKAAENFDPNQFFTAVLLSKTSRNCLSPCTFTIQQPQTASKARILCLKISGNTVVLNQLIK
jgi:hypothetical protein